ncbi:MAG: YigZ family protein [Clostridiales bacterium]|nr:YigZ family protein [Clostridiales bacterium]
MEKTYKMLKQYGEASFIERKSRFISYAMPVTTEEEAIEFLNSIRKKHYDATHNCYAYILGENAEIQRSSDDGEPSGTAGIPILEIIRKEGLTNTIVVVTRYFGGILLGAGGLIRSYAEGAKLALSAAGIIEVKAFSFFAIHIDYSYLGKIQHEALKKQYIIQNIDYTDLVKITLLVSPKYKDSLVKDINNWTNGNVLIEYMKDDMVKIDLDTGLPF